MGQTRSHISPLITSYLFVDEYLTKLPPPKNIASCPVAELHIPADRQLSDETLNLIEQNAEKVVSIQRSAPASVPMSSFDSSVLLSILFRSKKLETCNLSATKVSPFKKKRSAIRSFPSCSLSSPQDFGPSRMFSEPDCIEPSSDIGDEMFGDEMFGDEMFNAKRTNDQESQLRYFSIHKLTDAVETAVAACLASHFRRKHEQDDTLTRHMNGHVGGHSQSEDPLHRTELEVPVTLASKLVSLLSERHTESGIFRSDPQPYRPLKLTLFVPSTCGWLNVSLLTIFFRLVPRLPSNCEVTRTIQLESVTSIQPFIVLWAFNLFASQHDLPWRLSCHPFVYRNKQFLPELHKLWLLDSSPGGGPFPLVAGASNSPMTIAPIEHQLTVPLTVLPGNEDEEIEWRPPGLETDLTDLLTALLDAAMTDTTLTHATPTTTTAAQNNGTRRPRSPAVEQRQRNERTSEHPEPSENQRFCENWVAFWLDGRFHAGTLMPRRLDQIFHD